MRRSLFAVAALLPTLAAAQSAGQWRDAAHSWGSLCRYCHEAPIGPALFGRNLPQTYISLTVRMGHNAMPAFSFTQIGDGELATLARWISQQPAATPTVHP